MSVKNIRVYVCMYVLKVEFCNPARIYAKNFSSWKCMLKCLKKVSCSFDAFGDVRLYVIRFYIKDNFDVFIVIMLIVPLIQISLENCVVQCALIRTNVCWFVIFVFFVRSMCLCMYILRYHMNECLMIYTQCFDLNYVSCT